MWSSKEYPGTGWKDVPDLEYMSRSMRRSMASAPDPRILCRAWEKAAALERLINSSLLAWWILSRQARNVAVVLSKICVRTSVLASDNRASTPVLRAHESRSVLSKDKLYQRFNYSTKLSVLWTTIK